MNDVMSGTVHRAWKDYFVDLIGPVVSKGAYSSPLPSGMLFLFVVENRNITLDLYMSSVDRCKSPSINLFAKTNPMIRIRLAAACVLASIVLSA